MMQCWKQLEKSAYDEFINGQKLNFNDNPGRIYDCYIRPKGNEILFRECSIDKRYTGEFQQKLQVLKEKTKTKKALFLTIISTNGINENSYSSRLLQKTLPPKFYLHR